MFGLTKSERSTRPLDFGERGDVADGFLGDDGLNVQHRLTMRYQNPPADQEGQPAEPASAVDVPSHRSKILGNNAPPYIPRRGNSARRRLARLPRQRQEMVVDYRIHAC